MLPRMALQLDVWKHMGDKPAPQQYKLLCTVLQGSVGRRPSSTALCQAECVKLTRLQVRQDPRGPPHDAPQTDTGKLC